MFTRTAHLFACSAMLDSLARFTALTLSLAGSLTWSWARDTVEYFHPVFKVSWITVEWCKNYVMNPRSLPSINLVDCRRPWNSKSFPVVSLVKSTKMRKILCKTFSQTWIFITARQRQLISFFRLKRGKRRKMAQWIGTLIREYRIEQYYALLGWFEFEAGLKRSLNVN